MVNTIKNGTQKPPARYMYMSPLAVAVNADRPLIEFSLNYERLLELFIQDKFEDINLFIKEIHRYLFEYLRTKYTLEEILSSIIKVSKLGAAKYGLFSYKNTLKVSDIMDAIGRHLFKYLSGELIDDESKVSHEFHILANIYILVYNTGNNDLKELQS
jgi:hypothetical protein